MYEPTRAEIDRALRIARRYQERFAGGDAPSAALEGLAKACAGYDPAHATSAAFWTYAAKFVVGYLRHDRRAATELDRVRYAALQRGEPVERAEWELRPLSLDELIPGVDGKSLARGELVPDPRPTPEEQALAAYPLDGMLDAALSRLDARLRFVVWEYVVEGRTQGEIGRQLGVSQMHVSRLIQRGLERLRTMLEA